MIEDIESDRPICYEPDCNEPGEFYTYPEQHLNVETVDFHETYCYCEHHAGTHGFCYGCREFWGGVEEFEFGEFSHILKLCPECWEAFSECFDNGNDFHDPFDYHDEYDY